jgi:hypothetical protein
MKRLLPLLFLFSSLSAQTPFSQDSAFSFLKVLASDIGPRPLGSPNERKALEFGLRKFQEFGLHEVYLMPMMTATSELTKQSFNTSSGIAVGILRGATKRMIVIGGHIDSASPFVP